MAVWMCIGSHMNCSHSSLQSSSSSKWDQRDVVGVAQLGHLAHVINRGREHHDISREAGMVGLVLAMMLPHSEGGREVFATNNTRQCIPHVICHLTVAVCA